MSRFFAFFFRFPFVANASIYSNVCLCCGCVRSDSTTDSINLDDLLSMDYSQLMKKKVGDLVDIVHGLGIAAKGLLLEKKSDYVRAISDFIRTNKRKWNIDL